MRPSDRMQALVTPAPVYPTSSIARRSPCSDRPRTGQGDAGLDRWIARERESADDPRPGPGRRPRGRPPGPRGPHEEPEPMPPGPSRPDRVPAMLRAMPRPPPAVRAAGRLLAGRRAVHAGRVAREPCRPATGNARGECFRSNAEGAPDDHASHRRESECTAGEAPRRDDAGIGRAEIATPSIACLTRATRRRWK